VFYKFIVSGNYFQFKQSYIGIKPNTLKANKTREHNKYLKETYNLDGLQRDQQDIATKRKDNLQRARNNFKLLAHANANKYAKLITLTTKEVLSIEDFMKSFHSFIKHLKREVKEPLKYIGVYELQDRGAPHAHIIFFNEKFLDFNRALKSWRSIIGGLGSVQIKQLEPNKHINYLISYLKESAITSLGRKSIIRSCNLEKPKVYQDTIPPHLKNIFLKVEYSRLMGNNEGNSFEHIYGYLSKEPQEFHIGDALKFADISIIRMNRFTKAKEKLKDMGVD